MLEGALKHPDPLQETLLLFLRQLGRLTVRKLLFYQAKLVLKLLLDRPICCLIVGLEVLESLVSTEAFQREDSY